MLSIFLMVISTLHSPQVYAGSELIGQVMLPKKSVADGPSSGQFKNKLKNNSLLIDKQPVMGLSAMLVTDKQDTYWFLTDNGFGEKNASADFIPRLYEVQITADGNATYMKKYLEFTDSNKKLSFPIQADYDHYYNDINNPKVDEQIIQRRILTGADIDPESIQIDANHHLWIGEEYGPFLIETDFQGNVLNKEYEIPGIQSKDHPIKPLENANIGSSGGIEAMAITPDKQTLYLILQKSVKGDSHGALRLYTFNIASKSFNPSYLFYPTDPGSRVTDMVAINRQHFYVLERGTKPYGNTIYQINLESITNGVLQKKLIMSLDDRVPSSLSLEVVGILDNNRIMVVNDNDGIGGTFFHVINAGPFDKVTLSQAVKYQAIKFKEQKKTLDLVKFKMKDGYFHDDDLVSWFITILYLIAILVFLRVFLLSRQYSIDSVLWLILTVFIVILGVNKQFDIQTDITNYLREIARLEGWYDYRAAFQKILLLMALIGFFTLFTARLLFKNYWIKYKFLFIGFGLLIFYIAARLISLHIVDSAFRYKILGVIKLHQLLESSFVMLLIITCWHFNKRYFEKACNIKKRLNKNEYRIRYADEYIDCPACYSSMKSPANDLKNFKCKKCGFLFYTKLN